MQSFPLDAITDQWIKNASPFAVVDSRARIWQWKSINKEVRCAQDPSWTAILWEKKQKKPKIKRKNRLIPCRVVSAIALSYVHSYLEGNPCCEISLPVTEPRFDCRKKGLPNSFWHKLHNAIHNRGPRHVYGYLVVKYFLSMTPISVIIYIHLKQQLSQRNIWSAQTVLENSFLISKILW